MHLLGIPRGSKGFLPVFFPWPAVHQVDETLGSSPDTKKGRCHDYQLKRHVVLTWKYTGYSFILVRVYAKHIYQKFFWDYIPIFIIFLLKVPKLEVCNNASWIECWIHFYFYFFVMNLPLTLLNPETGWGPLQSFLSSIKPVLNLVFPNSFILLDNSIHDNTACFYIIQPKFD